MQERTSFLQLQQIAAHTFLAARQRQLITFMRAGGPLDPGSIQCERTPAFISHPKLLISILGSSDQLPSTMSSTGGPVAHEEAGWCYSAEDCEAWAWPSSLCTGYTSPLPRV